jgi:hypothetical protein
MVAALDVELTAEERKHIDEPYEPRSIVSLRVVPPAYKWLTAVRPRVECNVTFGPDVACIGSAALMQRSLRG